MIYLSLNCARGFPQLLLSRSMPISFGSDKLVSATPSSSDTSRTMEWKISLMTLFEFFDSASHVTSSNVCNAFCSGNKNLFNEDKNCPKLKLHFYSCSQIPQKTNKTFLIKLIV